MTYQEKVKHHCRKAVAAVQDAVQAVTNPLVTEPGSGYVTDRPNSYLLKGLKAPHVYGYPDQNEDVRTTVVAESAPRRVDRNNMLHYDEREHKPMTMERRFRRL